MIPAEIHISGPRTLTGTLSVSGAKNAALPELAAACLCSGELVLTNLPVVEDIRVMLAALQQLGAEVDREPVGHSARIHLPVVTSSEVPAEIVQTSRASILLLGPLLARTGRGRVSLPGGCPIGDRKVNYHLEGLARMGAEIHENQGYIEAVTDGLRGTEYRFPVKTVTGTENLIMAAVLARGTTVLGNCALEPEVGDLIELLRGMGADIASGGGEELTITGVARLEGTRHRIIPDRIEAGTFAIAGALPGNDLCSATAEPAHLGSLLDLLRTVGADVRVENGQLRVTAGSTLSPIEVETSPYPGFPTDLQAQLTTLLTQVPGTSRVRETIFNDRFRHIAELQRLGASIEVVGDTARISGRVSLRGAVLTTTDLRASAALVLGGLLAHGDTVIRNAYQLFRGYEGLAEKLQNVGGAITIRMLEAAR